MKIGSIAMLGAAAFSAAGALAALDPSVPDATSPAGCWARLYELPGYAGDKLTVTGPADVEAVARTAGRDWSGPRSLVLGPNARLEATNPGDRSKVTIAPGQDIPDFRNAEPPQLLASLGEMRLECVD